jgi:SAM-dependent methyltransferase
MMLLTKDDAFESSGPISNDSSAHLMTTSQSTSQFSSAKHAQGAWNTKAISTRSPVLRSLIGFMSFKRALVDSLARQAFSASLILDVGCGKGAYAYWFLGRKPAAVVIGLDISCVALQEIKSQKKPGVFLAVCADAARMPFKPEVFDVVYSIDTLGHIPDINHSLDEVLRVAKPGARCAFHSECRDYQNRWPDKQLILANGKDIPAAYDGHVSLLLSSQLRDAYSRRFVLRTFYSPAGYLGWLLGYPEKYVPAFLKARRYLRVALCACFGIIKKIPLLGWCMRFVNICTNHLELALGLEGGGSCFAIVEKPR